MWWSSLIVLPPGDPSSPALRLSCPRGGFYPELPRGAYFFTSYLAHVWGFYQELPRGAIYSLYRHFSVPRLLWVKLFLPSVWLVGTSWTFPQASSSTGILG